MWGWLTILRFECSSEALCAALHSIVCSNGVETEAMLEHGGTGGISCYKTCHSLSSSRQQPMLPRFSCNIQKDVNIQRPGTGSYVLVNMDKLDMEQCFCFFDLFWLRHTSSGNHLSTYLPSVCFWATVPYTANGNHAALILFVPQ